MREGSRKEQGGRSTREEGRSRSRSKEKGRWWKAEELGKTG